MLEQQCRSTASLLGVLFLTSILPADAGPSYLLLLQSALSLQAQLNTYHKQFALVEYRGKYLKAG